MDDEVILNIGDHKFLMSLEESIAVSRLLNSSCRVERTWEPSMHNANVRRPPSMAAAFVTPMTALFKMELEANMKLLEKK